MPQAVILNELGGPEKLELKDIPGVAAEPHEIRIEQSAIGVNYIDTYFREGLYGAELPAILGDQAVGSVIEVGAQVSGYAIGDQVAYASVFGSYQQERCVDANKVVKIPSDVSSLAIAGTLTRGLTAEYLLCRLHAVKPGETIVVHAAAGGTGAIICQWAKALGATVIGTVGDESKFSVAEHYGCDHVLNHRDSSLIEKIKELTAGRLVDVVYDSIGKDTFETSLQCIKPRGLMVAYGNASGKPEPLEVLSLARLGSLFLTRPILSHYIGTRADFTLSTNRYFKVLTQGLVKLPEIREFRLIDAANAHRHLQDRKQLSIPVLVP